MGIAEGALDGMIGLLILVLAGGALYARTLYASVATFLTFGIILALAWARLGAPDLALAEAIIGAGLTGALLFNALRGMSSGPSHQQSWRRWLIASLFPLLALPLIWQAVWHDASTGSALPELVSQHMDESGVSHPVTAVLLNFRSWDTLLELAVLLVALLGVRAVALRTTAYPTPWPAMLAWSKNLVPLIIVVAGYVLWRGKSAPGGAFQAGALLAAGAIILRLNHLLPPLRWSSWRLRLSVSAGLATFFAIAVFSAVWGEGWLQYPNAHSGSLILVIEALATLSIATALTLLVVGEEEELSA